MSHLGHPSNLVQATPQAQQDSDDCRKQDQKPQKKSEKTDKQPPNKRRGSKQTAVGVQDWLSDVYSESSRLIPHEAVDGISLSLEVFKDCREELVRASKELQVWLESGTLTPETVSPISDLHKI